MAAAIELIETLDEFQSEYRKTIGMVLPHRPSKEANVDNIRRYGDGVGDYNPLYRDLEYARSSRFGDLTAPPTFLYSVSLGVVAGETGAIDRRRVSTQFLPVNYAGAEIDFVRPVWRNDTITAQETVGETQRKTSKRIGPINFNTGHVVFSNQRQEVVATVKTLMARYQNTGATLEYDRKPKADQGESNVRSELVPADPLVWERTRRGSDTLVLGRCRRRRVDSIVEEGHLLSYRALLVYTRCSRYRKKYPSLTRGGRIARLGWRRSV